MAMELRRTIPTRQVLAALLQEPERSSASRRLARVHELLHLGSGFVLLLALGALGFDRLARLLRGVGVVRGLVGHGCAPSTRGRIGSVARTVRPSGVRRETVRWAPAAQLFFWCVSFSICGVVSAFDLRSTRFSL